MRRTLTRSTILVLVLASVFVACGGNKTLENATELLDAGDATRAVTLLEEEARENPRDGDTLRLLARAAVRVGRDDTAVDALDRAQALGEKDSVKVSAVRLEIWEGLFDPVRDVLDTLDRADAADRAGALAGIDRAERIDPRRAGNPAARASLLPEDSTAESEIDSLLGAAVALSASDPASVPTVAWALMIRARGLSDRGDLTAAVEAGRLASELVPGDVRVEYDLGVHLFQLGEATRDTSSLRAAAARFVRVLEAIPDDVDARFNLALCHYRLGEKEVSEEQVTRLLADYPLVARAHRLAARLSLAQGDTLRARGHVAAMRGLGGEDVPVAGSVLQVSSDGGRAARKHVVFEGWPDRIQRYQERGGGVVEVWFYLDPPRVFAFSNGKQISELELAGGPG